jgi:ERCC4-type nuclease
LLNYVEAFEEFFDTHKEIAKNFHRGWRIDLVADGENVKQIANRRAFKEVKGTGRVARITWLDFLDRAKKVHEQFLEIHDLGERTKRTKATARIGRKA